MSSKERERAAARRRHERYLQRRAAEQAEQKRRRLVAGAVFAVAVLAVALAVFLLRDDDVLDGPVAPVAGEGTETAPGEAASDDAASDDSTATDDAGADTTDTSAAGETYTLPDPAFAEGRTWTGTIRTDVGDIGIELDGAAAPQAVASFVSLAQQDFFEDTSCHRLVTAGIKVLQCGDPTGTGQGGPGYSFGPVENAPADDVYPAGTIAMARVPGDGESMGSQFFLVYEDSTIPADTAGGYTVLGRVTSGLDVVTAVADAGVEGGEPDGPPATGVTIQGVETQ